MKTIISSLMVLMVFLYLSSSCEAVYKWVDEKGRTWITDYPSPKSANKKAAEAEKEKAQSQPDETAVSENKEAQPSDQKKDEGILFKLPEDIQKRMPVFPRGDNMPMMSGPFMAMMSGFLVIMAIVGIAAYIFMSLCLYLIAKKLDVPNPWVAWIPVANLWTVAAAAGREWWWAVMILGMGVLSAIPMIGILFNIAGVGVWIYLWMCITENLGRNKWLGLLIIVPLVNFVWMGILAFSKQEAYSYPSDMSPSHD